MNKSESIANLAKALAAAQAEFQAVPKTADNPFFRSKYADLPAVVMAASPILSAHGLAVSQFCDFDGEHDLLTTVLMHASGEWLEATMRLYLPKQDAQSQGSATTYARRYAYSASVGIVTEADDDGNAATKAPRPTGTTRRAAPARGPRLSTSEKEMMALHDDDARARRRAETSRGEESLPKAPRPPADTPPAGEGLYDAPEVKDHLPTKWRNEMTRRLAKVGLFDDEQVGLVLKFATGNRCRVLTGLRPDEAESVDEAISSLESGELVVEGGVITTKKRSA